jgi:cytochrome c oxidase subunit 2
MPSAVDLVGRRGAIRGWWRVPAWTVAGLLTPTLGYAAESAGYRSSMSFMHAYGTKNYSVVAILWGTIAISLLVTAIITVLVVVGVLRRRTRTDWPASIPPERGGSGMRWIYIGVALSLPVLFGTAIWNYAVLAEIASPPSRTAFTIRVTGHQWWWEFRYIGADPSRGFTTANEIHIPVGRPVRIELATADVIHSFWVPELTGKMDTIPGQNNTTWLEADKPGSYRGQCTEYCGLQHAHMGLVVVADPPDKFAAWWDRELAAPTTPVDEPARRRFMQGQLVFARHCAVCHTIRGTSAGGKVGPDLSHLMLRSTLAAATLPNTPGALSGWILEPQRIKPGNLMPNIVLSAGELASVRTYLLSLQ